MAEQAAKAMLVSLFEQQTQLGSVAGVVNYVPFPGAFEPHSRDP